MSESNKVRLCWSLHADALREDEGDAAPAFCCSSTQVEEEVAGDEDNGSGKGWATAISDCNCLREEGREGPASGAVACWSSDSTIWTRDSELRAELGPPLPCTASSYEGRVTWTPSTMIDTGWPDTPWSRLDIEDQRICYNLFPHYH